MLVLSRRPDQSLMLGDEIKITILTVKGKQVRIGIEAPPNVSVHREEIYNAIATEDKKLNAKEKAP